MTTYVLHCRWDERYAGDGFFTGPLPEEWDLYAREGAANDAAAESESMGAEVEVYPLTDDLPADVLAALNQPSKSVSWCPTHKVWSVWTYDGGPGFTGATIWWVDGSCGCQFADLSADNLEAAR